MELETINQLMINFIEVIAHVLMRVAFFPFFGIPFSILLISVAAIYMTVILPKNPFSMLMFGLKQQKSDKTDNNYISPFQSLCASLSMSVGFGNIAGSIVAIIIAGPSAVFWMFIAQIIAMPVKFFEVASCCIAIKNDVSTAQEKLNIGSISYIKDACKKIKISPRFLKIVTSIYALMLAAATLSGGNIFQANQLHQMLKNGLMHNMTDTFISIFIVIIVLLVVVGGIKFISKITATMVPFMALSYVLLCFIAIIRNSHLLLESFKIITNDIFSNGLCNGFLCVVIVSLQRAFFANMAGSGITSGTHVMAKDSIRQSCLAMIEPIVSSLFVCLPTGIVFVIFSINNPEIFTETNHMIAISKILSSDYLSLSIILDIAIFVLVYTTIISISYTFQSSWEFFFGKKYQSLCKAFFITCTYLGTVSSFNLVLKLADGILFALFMISITALLIVSRSTAREAKQYFKQQVD